MARNYKYKRTSKRVYRRRSVWRTAKKAAMAVINREAEHKIQTINWVGAGGSPIAVTLQCPAAAGSNVVFWHQPLYDPTNPGLSVVFTQGAANNQVIGNKLKIQRLHVKYSIEIVPSATVLVTRMRLIVYSCREGVDIGVGGNTVAQVPTDFPVFFNGQFGPRAFQKYNILSDKVHDLPYQQLNADGNANKPFIIDKEILIKNSRGYDATINDANGTCQGLNSNVFTVGYFAIFQLYGATTNPANAPYAFHRQSAAASFIDM